MAADYYELLGIKRDASQDEIKRAFRRQAKKYHPDANQGDPTAETRFKEINEAYEVLSDPEKRSQYDQFGANWKNYQGFSGGPGGPGGPGGAYTRVDMEDLSDLFENFFGGFGRSRGGAGTAGGPRTGGFSMPGQDIEQPVRISLREAYEGAVRIVTRDGEQKRIQIPAGARDGTRVRVKGEGSPGVYGGQPGDLYLVVEVEPDNQFERVDDDLYVDVQIDVFTAMLGGSVQVPTMTRPVRLNIPAGTQSGRKFRLTGKGMPVLRQKDKHGNLYARVLITVPEHMTDEQREMAERLRESLGYQPT